MAEKAMETIGIDRLDALTNAIHTVRRAGTLSIIGVYGGAADPLPILEQDDDVLGTEDLASLHLRLDEAPRGYEIFQKKEENATKVVLHP